MTYNILVLENNKIESAQLKQYLQNYSPDIKVSVAADLESAHQFINEKIPFLAFFIDIALSEGTDNQDGLTFAEQLCSMKQYQNIPMLFTTSFVGHVLDAVNLLHCFAYILKPYNESEIHHHLKEIFMQQPQNFMLKTLDGVHVRIDFDQLYYIEAQGRNLIYYTATGSFHSRQYTMKRMEEVLPTYFTRVHRSFIINRNFVERYDTVNHLVKLSLVPEQIPMSRTFRFDN